MWPADVCCQRRLNNMDRLPLPQNDPKRAQREALAIGAMNDAAELLRGVDPAMVPDLVVSLLRALKLSDVVLDDLRRAIDDRLAWGFWPRDPDEKSP